MIEPTEKDIGRSVIYDPPKRFGVCGRGEEGVITSFNKLRVGRQIVFVRYGTDHHSKGTDSRDLRWGQ